MVGVLVPMPEEIELILASMQVNKRTFIGSREFFEGSLAGKACVVSLSRIGKVASAVTAYSMIQTFGAESIILTGAAGGIDKALKIGDLVIANETIQYDMDCSPLFPKYEIPLLEKSRFPCDQRLVALAKESFQELLDHGVPKFLATEQIHTFRLNNVEVHNGLIGSGDLFVSDAVNARKIKEEIEDILCVEMEAGAVGQVCFEQNIPYVVLRTISDLADDEAHIDFVQFVKNVVSPYTLAMVCNLLKKM